MSKDEWYSGKTGESLCHTLLNFIKISRKFVNLYGRVDSRGIFFH